MAASFPVGILTATIVMFLWGTTVTCEFPMTLTLERSIPLNNEMKLSKLKAFDNARHRRLIQSSNDTDFPLEGTYDPYVAGLYYTKVQLGSPPRDFHVQVDTGSDPLWVTCSSCSDCPDNTELEIELNSFDPEKSSTYSPVSCSDRICNREFGSPDAICSNNRCSYTFEYADDSSSAGFYVSDVIHFATAISNGSSSSPVLFGCSTELIGNLVKNERGVDGIIGFGQGKVSVISQLSSKGLVPKVFSHCLRGDDQGGGMLVLGEIVEPNIVFTPLISSGSHYNIDLKSIHVNGNKLAIDSPVFQTSENQGTVVDSGTTMAYLPEGVYEVFLKAIEDAVPGGSVTGMYVADGSQCFFTQNSISQVFPNVTLNFAGGASMVWKPKDYLLHHQTLDGVEQGWCIGIQKIQRGQWLTILGDIVLKDRIIVYDLAAQRLGWAEYNCSQPFNVSVNLNSGWRSSLGTSRDRPHETAILALFVTLTCCFFFFF